MAGMRRMPCGNMLLYDEYMKGFGVWPDPLHQSFRVLLGENIVVFENALDYNYN
jgi:hypothetical protein